MKDEMMNVAQDNAVVEIEKENEEMMNEEIKSVETAVEEVVAQEVAVVEPVAEPVVEEPKKKEKKEKKSKAPKTKKEKAPKEKKTEEVKNEEKVNAILSITDVTALYAEMGIKCYNPTAKGNYRIMGYKGGSSLNTTKKEYNIYTTDEDFEALTSAKIEGVELAKGANSRDKVRPNTVTIRTLDVLKAALAVYARNTKNQVVAVTA